MMITAYDPFLVMQDQNKVYGFTISLFEYIETIPTLWDSVKGLYIIVQALRERVLTIVILTDFIRENPELIPEGNGMKFLSDDGGETYNRCHCEYISLTRVVRVFPEPIRLLVLLSLV
jgi:alpha 1,2-mannosyltransferase